MDTLTHPMKLSTGSSRNSVKKPPTLRNVRRQRFDPVDRKAAIVREAASFFAERGFEGHTRDLAARLGITQPLLYRYFSSKEALIERVFKDVFVGRWNSDWEKLIIDRRIPLKERLVTFYQDYARAIITYEWVRLFMFAGLRDLDFNARYLGFLRRHFFSKAIAEIRREFGRPTKQIVPISRLEIEMILGLHARVFYLGVRRYIYNMPLKENVDDIINAHIASFLNEIQEILPTKSGARPRRGRPRTV